MWARSDVRRGDQAERVRAQRQGRRSALACSFAVPQRRAVAIRWVRGPAAPGSMRLEHADHTPAHRGYVQGRGPLTTHTLALELVDGRRATVDFKHERLPACRQEAGGRPGTYG